MINAFCSMLKMIKEKIYTRLISIIDTTTSALGDLYCHILHKKAEIKLRGKREPINVLFFAIFASVWKYDSLYWLLKKDKRFNPVILVCPQVNMGRESMLDNISKCYNDFKQRGYDVVMSYNVNDDSYVDANSLNPDIIIYTNPYEGLIDDRYYIDKFKNTLTCYCNYGYILIGDRWGIALPFHRRVWKYFTEYDYSKDSKMSKIKLAYNNRVPTGYPLYDDFVEHQKSLHLKQLPDYKLSGKKVVIWAPHHTIESDNPLLKFSKFLFIADYMQDVRKRFEESVFFVFKPHPLLKVKLYETKGWGKKRTDDYYDLWAKSCNSAVVEGDYIDLFLYSDAMIHDCASFTIEYLYTKKPIMYLADESHGNQFNEVGQKAYGCHYSYNTERDIDEFIETVVLKGIDPKKSIRETFYNLYLVPPSGCTVSENMMNDIAKSLGI